MSLVMKRRSIRKYTNEVITEEVINTLLKSAMQAPSACNQQPWEFVVIDDLKSLQQLSDMSAGTYMLKNVTKAIAVIMTPTTVTRSEGLRPQDCAAATQNILLEATNQGLGACWIGVYPLEERVAYANKILNVPEDKNVFCLISLGYPEEQSSVIERFDPSRIKRNRY